MWSEEDERAFLKTFEVIRNQIRNDLRMKSDVFESNMDEVITYNVPHGKKTRGKIVVEAYRVLRQGDSEENLEMSRIVGWCVEFLQAALIIADDMMDQSQTRRKQQCWYLRSPRGAPNHVGCMLSAVYFLLKANCRQHKNYVKLIETFLDIERCTVIGQTLDGLSEFTKKSDASKVLTHSRVTSIATVKGAYYTTVLPLRLALYLANTDEPTTHKNAESVALRIGVLFQAQDDFLDMYGDPKLTGKIGTDIGDGKCTWFAAEAMIRMSDQMKQDFKNNYGKKEEAAVQAIKNIYEQLNLKAVFEEFEKNEYKEILSDIDKLETSFAALKEALSLMLSVCYNRKM